MTSSVKPYITKYGRVEYKRMAEDALTKLRIREAELATIPKPVRALCRIVCRFVRARGA